MQQLEEEIGVELFEPAGRGVRIRDPDGEPVLIDPRKSSPRLYDDTIAAFRGLTFGPESVAPVLTLGSGRHAIWRPVADLHIEMRDIAMWRGEDASSPLLAPPIEIVRETAPEVARGRKGRKRRPRA